MTSTDDYYHRAAVAAEQDAKLRFPPITGQLNQPRLPDQLPEPPEADSPPGYGDLLSDEDISRLRPAPMAPPPLRPAEADPFFGADLKAPGAKADSGKLRPTLILRDMADAVAAVIKIGTDGAAKYSDGGWKQVPKGEERYEDADLRHMLKRFTGETIDADSLGLHLAHEAWNALAKLQLYLNAHPEQKVKL